MGADLSVWNLNVVAVWRRLDTVDDADECVAEDCSQIVELLLLFLVRARTLEAHLPSQDQGVHSLLQVVEELTLTHETEISDSTDGKYFDIGGKFSTFENNIQKSHYSLSLDVGLLAKAGDDVLNNSSAHSPAADVKPVSGKFSILNGLLDQIQNVICQTHNDVLLKRVDHAINDQKRTLPHGIFSADMGDDSHASLVKSFIKMRGFKSSDDDLQEATHGVHQMFDLLLVVLTGLCKDLVLNEV